MIKGSVLFQEMPELSDTLYHEMNMNWGTPLSFKISQIAQRSSVRIMSLNCPPAETLGPMRTQ